MGQKHGYESFRVYPLMRPRFLYVAVCAALGTMPPRILSWYRGAMV